MALGHIDSDKGRDAVIKEGETEFHNKEKKKQNKKKHDTISTQTCCVLTTVPLI